MAVTSITSAIAVLRATAAAEGITVDQAAGVITRWEDQRKTEQMTSAEKREAHLVYAPQIAELFAADPDGDLDPAEVTHRLGMPDKQGARSFVRHQLKQLRLTYQQKGGEKVAAD